MRTWVEVLIVSLAGHVATKEALRPLLDFTGADASRASVIVTGDREHLLPIGMHGDIAIMSPRQCLNLFQK